MIHYFLSHMYTFFQIVVDLILLFLLVYSMNKERNKENVTLASHLPEDLEKVVNDTREVNAQFETALSERRVIINNLMKNLDAQIIRGEKLVEKLTSGEAEQLSGTPENDVSSFSNGLVKKVMTLLDNGLSVEEICSKCKKPRGEIELIMKLYSNGKRDAQFSN